MKFRFDRGLQFRRRLLWSGAVAGAFEGLAISTYQVLQKDPARMPQAVGWALLIGVTQFAIWSGLGWLASRRFREVGSIRSVFFLWTAAVVLGRYLLADRISRGLWLFAILGSVLVLALPARLWEKQKGRVGDAIVFAGVVLVGITSLLGLNPDNSYEAWIQGAFFLAIASATVALLTAAKRWPKATLASILGLAVLGPLGDRLRPHPEGPNVLFVLVDTTRQDHVPPFGRFVREPTVPKLAAEGTRFDQAVTVVPKTPESVASFWTGLYPHHHELRGIHDQLSPQLDTIGSVLRRAGYKTAALVDNGWLTRGRGFGHGFEHFLGYYEVTSPYGPWTDFSWLRLVDRLTVERVPRFSAQVRASRLTDEAIRLMDRLQNRRFFLYVHYFEPHWPYIPPAEKARKYGGPLRGQTAVNFALQLGITRGQLIFQNPLPRSENVKARRLYQGEVDNTLEQIGRLFGHLDALGLSRDTLVVFTTDHGHSLGEHDYYFHHGEFLYEDSVRIPLVLRWPGRIPSGLVVPAQVRSIDLAPTLFQLTKTAAPPRLDGRSLTRYFEEGAELDRGMPTFVESDLRMFEENLRRDVPGIAGKMRAIRTPHRKLILNPRRNGLQYELYDLDQDPGEVHDLSTDPTYAADFKELQRQLWSMIPEGERAQILAVSTGGVDPTADEKGSATDLEQLRSLGYIN